MKTPLDLWLLAAAMMFVGIGHFVMPQPFVDIVPDYLPAPWMLVYVSGAAEILGGLGLTLPATRRAAAWGLIALYVAVFPANIHMAIHDITPTGLPEIPAWAAWARLPLQAALIAWAYRFTRPLAER